MVSPSIAKGKRSGAASKAVCPGATFLTPHNNGLTSFLTTSETSRPAGGSCNPGKTLSSYNGRHTRPRGASHGTARQTISHVRCDVRPEEMETLCPRPLEWHSGRADLLRPLAGGLR